MITAHNYIEIESVLNSELKKTNGSEDWMYFSINPIGGVSGKFTVGYLLPTSHGVNTTKTLSECLEIYNAVMQKVLS